MDIGQWLHTIDRETPVQDDAFPVYRSTLPIDRHRSDGIEEIRSAMRVADDQNGIPHSPKPDIAIGKSSMLGELAADAYTRRKRRKTRHDRYEPKEPTRAFAASHVPKQKRPHRVKNGINAAMPPDKPEQSSRLTASATLLRVEHGKADSTSFSS